jgi:hypothetical protein
MPVLLPGNGVLSGSATKMPTPGRATDVAYAHDRVRDIQPIQE